MAKKISEEGVVDVELQKPKKDIFNDTIAQTRKSVAQQEEQTRESNTVESAAQKVQDIKKPSTSSSKSSASSSFSSVEDKFKKDQEGKKYSEKVIDKVQQEQQKKDEELKLKEEKKLEQEENKENNIDIAQKTDENLSKKSNQIKQNVQQKQQEVSRNTGNPLNKLKDTAEKKFKHFSQDTIQKGKEKIDKVQESSKKIKKIGRVLKSIGSFISSFWLPIIIALIIIEGVIPSIIAFSYKFGGSPHYYCDLLSDKATKKTEIFKRYCKTGSSGGNETLAQAAVSLVDLDRGTERVPQIEVAPGWSNWGDYKYIYDNTETHLDEGDYDNCTGYVGCAIRWALTDNWEVLQPDLYIGNTQYLNENWEEVNFSGNDDDLEPGDVFISENDGSSHIFIYVGSEILHERFPDAPEDHDSCGAGWTADPYARYLPKTNSWKSESSGHATWHVYRFIGEPDTPYKDLMPE